ncbi:acyltransferase family protein [Comamonas avium]|nr:acyltransferase family protein [Comamonas avium]
MEINRSAYRPDIDGLRAVAVMAVVLFHAFPNAIRGGFVGVDIFFVISGFLITSIIIKNLNHGSFSFIDFYSRRIKRIFPALIFILISCVVFGWFSLLPDEYKQLGKHISSGIGFVSNIAYWSESGYFDSSAELKPLLHLWSLGIEEQFYLLFPLIIWISWRLRLNILTIMVGVFLASLTLNLINIKIIPETVFYLLPYRAWELVAGGILACFILSKKENKNSLKLKINIFISRIIFNAEAYKGKRTLENIFSIFGVFLILLGFYAIDETKKFPGWWAIYPVLGSVFVILAGENAWINRVVLSSKLFVWVGLISFPLYLWHWPLLVFPRIIQGDTPSILVRSLSVVAALILSWVTFKFIEKPMRHGGALKTSILVFLGCLVFAVGVFIYKFDGFPDRPANTNSMISQFGWNGDQKDILCQNKIGEDAEFCRISKDKNPSILLIGDSIAWQYYFGLEEQTKNSEESVLAYTQGGCAAFFGFSNRFDFDSCLRVTKKMLDFAKNDSNINTVVFSSFPRVYSEDAHPLDLGYGLGSKEKFSSRIDFNNHVNTTFSGVMNEIISKGKTVVFVKNNPYLSFELKNCITRPFRQKDNSLCGEKYSSHVQYGLEYNQLLDDLIKKFPQIRVFDPAEALCDKDGDFCSPIKDGKMLYRDGQHLSKDGSKYLGDSLYKLINKP